MMVLIVLNEIKDYLKSLRFMLTCVLIMLLMSAGAIFFITNYKQQDKDFTEKRNKTLSLLSDMAPERNAIFTIFSQNIDSSEAWVYKTPNYLSFISEGHDRDLPDAFKPSAFRIHGPDKQIRSNMLLGRSDILDWAMIVGVILSFVSLIFVYDRISGERESGTLRLSLSNSVPRTVLIFGKYLAAFMCLSIILLLGILFQLVIITVVGNIQFQSADWFVIGLTYLLSLVYISVFLMLGLFISSTTKESATSLIIALFCWVLMVIIIPRTGGFAASQLVDIPTWNEASESAQQADLDAGRKWIAMNPEMEDSGGSMYWSPGEALDNGIVKADGWSQSFDDYRNKMIYQVELARKITLISPFGCFTSCLEELTESGFVHYKRFYDQIRAYKLTMRQYLLDIYPVSTKWFSRDSSRGEEENRALRDKISSMTLDFESIPKFEEKRTGLGILIYNALLSFLILVLFNFLFFTASFVSFLRYDVR